MYRLVNFNSLFDIYTCLVVNDLPVCTYGEGYTLGADNQTFIG